MADAAPSFSFYSRERVTCGRGECGGVDALQCEQRGRALHDRSPATASHSATASAFHSDHGRRSPARNRGRSLWGCSVIDCSAPTVMKLKMSASDSYSRMTRAMKRL